LWCICGLRTILPGLFYLLVYIGVVSILFLFILMLINVRISELSIDSLNSIYLALMLAFLYYLILDYSLHINSDYVV